jgi:hypothetical protein
VGVLEKETGTAEVGVVILIRRNFSCSILHTNKEYCAVKGFLTIKP